VAERERELLDEVAEAEHRASNPVLDEATLTAAVGAETARVLHSAHEVAAEVVAKAEAEANRLLTEAREEIHQIRANTEARLAEQSAASEASANELRERTERTAAATEEQARREAETLLEQAREECRAMVDEAQGLRARVLADLSKRRKVLHVQIEQLRAGRERLAETVVDVRRSVDAIASDLFAAEDNARLAAEAAGREALDQDQPGTPEELAAQLLADEQEAGAEIDVEETVKIVDVVEPAPDVDTGDATGEEPVEGSPEPDEGPAPAAAGEVDALFAKLRASRQASGTPEPEPVPESEVEAAVAPVADQDGGPEPVRSRDVASDQGADTARDGGDDDGDDGPPEERSPQALRRDELIDPIVTTLSRRLKRTLQDNQNELLDGLRSKGSRWSIDLLPDETEHIDSVSTAAVPALEQSAAAGVSFSGLRGAGGPKTDVLLDIAHDLAQAVVGPLRRRLADGDGLEGAEESVVAEHVGSAFREWKGERIERLAGDHVVAAFSAGTIAAALGEPSAQLEWVAVSDSGDPPCPDCEDNGLNGSQAPGEEFPTGHRHPPAHPGCRCLLVLSAT
jgi:vacuolar-type H+-ATPase subunit E/Vma4